MDESTKHELLLRLTPLKNSELLSVIEVKRFGLAVAPAEVQKPLAEEIEFARELYAMRMGLS